MPIYRIEKTGYRDISCLLSIAAIFPPEAKYRTMPDRKTDDEETFHFTIVNNKELPDERSAYITMNKRELSKLRDFIDGYLKTSITKEI